MQFITAFLRTNKFFLFLFFISIFSNFGFKTDTIEASVTGKVYGSGSPVSGATVILYAAGTDSPAAILEQTTTDNTGSFTLQANNSSDAVLYIVAKTEG
ncbi:MAG: hypothetical protein R2942_16280 [Ignavibacteria bacterium]